MPKLYIYLDAQAGVERKDSFTKIMQQLQEVLDLASANNFAIHPSSDALMNGELGATEARVNKLNTYLEQGQTIDSAWAVLQGWELIFLGEADYTQLLSNVKNAARYLNKYGAEALQQSEYASLLGDDLLIAFSKEGAGLSLLREGKLLPLRLDFEQVAYRQRLLRGGRQKEAVSRAVLQGIEDGALVFDATAGLGRESMILAHAGGRILAFERQLPIWIILSDALNRAQLSRFFPFTLPVLHRLGTIKDFKSDEVFSRPEVIYYDPMFPERESAAQVKKDMFIFQQVIGHDTDTEDFLKYALTLATKRVVVKRPSFAPAVETDEIKCTYSVDGGQCRFDCYTV